VIDRRLKQRHRRGVGVELVEPAHLRRVESVSVVRDRVPEGYQTGSTSSSVRILPEHAAKLFK
jgi:hypothetical protein